MNNEQSPIGGIAIALFIGICLIAATTAWMVNASVTQFHVYVIVALCSLLIACLVGIKVRSETLVYGPGWSTLSGLGASMNGRGWESVLMGFMTGIVLYSVLMLFCKFFDKKTH